MTLSAQTVLENRYRIDRLIAQGGMGAVYQGFDLKLHTEVALKENFLQTPESIRQFEREALILARLRHPSLPRVSDHFIHQGRQYLVMDFIEGQDLWQMIKVQGHSLSETQAVNYLKQVAEAVAYLHQQHPPIIHRDIKPQNIKLTPQGQAVLVDFGIAKVAEVGESTTTGAQGVTPGFSPPEQYSGMGTTPQSDIYALGATLYALLTLQRPPDSISLLAGGVKFIPPRVLNPHLSEQVSQAISHAMQPRLDQRPASVTAWLSELTGDTPTLFHNQQPITNDEPTSLSPQMKDTSYTLPSPPQQNLPHTKPRQHLPFMGLWRQAILITICLFLASFVYLINLMFSPQTKPEPIISETEFINPIATTEQVIPIQPTAAETSIPLANSATLEANSTTMAYQLATALAEQTRLFQPTATPTATPTDTLIPTPTDTITPEPTATSNLFDDIGLPVVPPTIPMLDDASQIEATSNTVKYVTYKGLQEVADFYSQTLTDAGWQVDPEEMSIEAENIMIGYMRGEEYLFITLTQEAEYVHVMAEYEAN